MRNDKRNYLLCIWYIYIYIYIYRFVYQCDNVWEHVVGPGMFLRGAGGLEAAEKAVKVLHDKSETTITIFMWGNYLYICWRYISIYAL